MAAGVQSVIGAEIGQTGRNRVLEDLLGPLQGVPGDQSVLDPLVERAILREEVVAGDRGRAPELEAEAERLADAQ